MGRCDAAHGVRTNAETPPMPAPREFGAEGIGLCRTEHMFFDGDRIAAMREMILPVPRVAAAQGAGQAAADAARTFKSCSRSWLACRSPSACSIRRCTSSCRKTDEEIAEVADVMGSR
jgi:pyruvate,orthophosphate dikinase